MKVTGRGRAQMATDEQNLYRWLGAYMKGIRRSKGMSQAAVGQSMGCTGAAVSYYEKGKSRPSVVVLIAWCRAVGADPADVMSNLAVALVDLGGTE